MRIKLSIEGDLARAVVWEAGRRGTEAQSLAMDLLTKSSRRMLKAWRRAHEAVIFLDERRRPREGGARSFEAVLQMAHGPSFRA